MPDCGTICPGLYDMSLLPPVDGTSWDIGRISCLLYEVKRGTKPVAEITVPLERVDLIVQEIETQQALYHVSVCGDTHARIFLCTYPHLIAVVKHLTGDNLSEDLFNCWVWGKAFGYSECAIAEYLSSVDTCRKEGPGESSI